MGGAKKTTSHTRKKEPKTAKKLLKQYFFFFKFPSATQQRSDWTSDRILSFSPTFTFTFHSGFFWSAQGFLDLSHSKTEWRGRSFDGLSVTFWYRCDDFSKKIFWLRSGTEIYLRSRRKLPMKSYPYAWFIPWIYEIMNYTR